MKPKHIIILSLVLIILAALVFVKNIFLKPETETAEYKKLEFSVEAHEIYSFVIQKNKGQEIAEFKRTDGQWFIPSKWGAKADKNKVENLLKGLCSLEGELRSSSPELLPDYGISDDEAYSFSFYDEKGVLKERLLAGIKKPDYGKSFIRRNNSSDVYLADNDVFFMINIYNDPKDSVFSLQSWIDKSIIDLDPENVDSLKIEKQHEKSRITAVDIKRETDKESNLKKWVSSIEEPALKLDASKIKEYFKKLKAMKAADIVNPSEKDYGFDDAYLILTIEEKGNTLEIVAGGLTDGDEKGRYIKSPDGFVYILKEHQMKDIDIDMSRFVPDKKQDPETAPAS
jgi:hypothetical protein